MWMDTVVEKLAAQQGTYFKTKIEDSSKITTGDGADNVPDNENAPVPGSGEQDYGDHHDDTFKAQVKESQDIREMLGLVKISGKGGSLLARIRPKGLGAADAVFSRVGGKTKIPAGPRILAPKASPVRNSLALGLIGAPVVGLTGKELLDNQAEAHNYAQAQMSTRQAPASGKSDKPGKKNESFLSPGMQKALLYGGIPLAAYGGYKLLGGGAEEEEEDEPRRRRRY